MVSICSMIAGPSTFWPATSFSRAKIGVLCRLPGSNSVRDKDPVRALPAVSICGSSGRSSCPIALTAILTIWIGSLLEAKRNSSHARYERPRAGCQRSRCRFDWHPAAGDFVVLSEIAGSDRPGFMLLPAGTLSASNQLRTRVSSSFSAERRLHRPPTSSGLRIVATYSVDNIAFMAPSAHRIPDSAAR